MHIWIDNTQLADATDINAALDQARAHTESSGRLIIDILVDGHPAPDELFEDEPQGLGSINELRFTTADTKELIVETGQTAIDSIQLIQADQQAATQQLRSGDLEDSMETMRAIMEGWQAVRDIVDQLAQIAQININELKVDTHTGNQIIDALSSALTEVRENLKNEDWSSLGDTIEYDLNELAAQWSSLLNAIVNHVQAS
ncbi:MAG: hypothetical protein AB8C13_04685 [Phycisphaerales bacterium]